MINISKLLTDKAMLEYYKSGQVVIKDGECECRKMYILLEGTVGVYKNYKEQGELQIAVLLPQSFFGEMSLFLDKGRTATVVARDDITVLAIDPTNALDFFTKQPGAAFSLIQTLCMRLDCTNVNMAEHRAVYERSLMCLTNEKSELEITASIDPLTGVYNRRFFMETADMRIETAKKRNKKTYIVLFDLDRFKSINDTFGHQGGDIVLISVADTVSGCIRSDDLFARYGGEEFILLISCDCDNSALELVERIRQNISASKTSGFKNIEISVTASFGVCEVSPEIDIEAAISFADGALYRAKNEGRNRTVFWKN